MVTPRRFRTVCNLLCTMRVGCPSLHWKIVWLLLEDLWLESEARKQELINLF
ncbi:unnamed protein product [Nezara viridula]|uniref:Uncharacterized protein n=1 Tax=Nezara viridula TaxID=85310 RepID=A0A9P0E6W4_NEZVI|nr:unnamed protein product [Nezara viridula]